MDWKKVLAVAGGAAGVCAVLYVLRGRANARQDLPAGEDNKENRKRGVSVDEITKEEVQQILQEIISTQGQIKVFTKGIIQDLAKHALNLEQTYNKVKAVMPPDPLDKYGLSMMDFDQLLERHQSDPNVRESIAKIMGAPDPARCASEKVQAITVKKIVELHGFMLEELDSLVQDFGKMQDKESYDMKAITIAAQATVNAKIESKYGITSEDVESAVLMYHTMLATDQEFAAINIKIQHTMGKLMGTPFASN